MPTSVRTGMIIPRYIKKLKLYYWLCMTNEELLIIYKDIFNLSVKT